MAENNNYLDNVYENLKHAYGDNFTTSLDDFKSKMISEEEYRSNVYDNLKHAYGDNFDKSIEDFTSSFLNDSKASPMSSAQTRFDELEREFGVEPPKKKEESTSEPSVETGEPASGSTATETESEFITPDFSTKDAPVRDKMDLSDLAVATVEPAPEKPSMVAKLNTKALTPDLIAKDEEDAVPRLNELFGEHFTFEEAGTGYDAVLVKSKKTGNKKIFTLDAFTDAGDVKNTRKIKEWMERENGPTREEVNAYYQEDFRELASEITAFNKQEEELQSLTKAIKHLRSTGQIKDENDPRYKEYIKLFDKHKADLERLTQKEETLTEGMKKDLDAASIKEQKYFQGDEKFVGSITKGDVGKVLELMDSFTENKRMYVEFGDLIDGISGAIAGTGKDQSELVNFGMKIYREGENISKEDLEALIALQKRMESAPMSRETQMMHLEYDKIIEEGGTHAEAVITSFIKNPQAALELTATSLRAMMNENSLAEAAKVELMAATAGLGASIPTGGLSAPVTVPAAMAGAIPLATAMAGATMELGITIAEGLKEHIDLENAKREANGQELLEYNPETIRMVLQDEEVFNKIVNKGLKRGATIGVIDGFLTALGAKMGSAVFSKTGSRVLQAGLTAPLEMIGEGIGEGSAQLLTDGKLDWKEVNMEMAGGGYGTVTTMVSSLNQDGEYTINGGKVDKVELNKVIDTATAEELVEMDIDIKGDKQAYDKLHGKIEDKKIVDSMPEGLTEEEQQRALELERELKVLEENKTDSVSHNKKVSERKAELNELYDVEGRKEKAAEEAKVEERRKKELLAVSEEIEGMSDEEIKETAAERIDKRVKINEKYDAELAALETGTDTTTETGTETGTETDTDLDKEAADLEETLANEEKTGPTTVESKTEESPSAVEKSNKDLKTPRNENISMKGLAKKVANAAKALPKGMKIVVHKTQAEYEAATAKETKNGKSLTGKGVFIPKTGTIHINAATANARTVAHEVLHARIVSKLGGVASDINQSATALYNKVKDAADLTEQERAWLDNFRANYIQAKIDEKAAEGVTITEEQAIDMANADEEFLAELAGIVSQKGKAVSRTFKAAVMDFFMEIANKFGANFTTSQEALDFINSVGLSTEGDVTIQDSAVDAKKRQEAKAKAKEKKAQEEAKAKQEAKAKRDEIRKKKAESRRKALEETKKKISEKIDSAYETLSTKEKALIEKFKEQEGVIADTAEYIRDKTFDFISGVKKVPEKLRPILQKIAKKVLQGALVMSLLISSTGQAIAPQNATIESAPISIETTVEAQISDKQFFNSLTDAAQSVYKKMADSNRAYIIAEKATGTVHLVDSNNKLIESFPALYGRIAGEDPNGYFSRLPDGSLNRNHDKATTPAGSFVLKKTQNPNSINTYEGNVFNLYNQDGTIAKAGEAGVIAFHQTSEVNLEQRLAALASETPADNKQSGGCINISKENFEKYVKPNFGEGTNFFITPDVTEDIAEREQIDVKDSLKDGGLSVEANTIEDLIEGNGDFFLGELSERESKEIPLISDFSGIVPQFNLDNALNKFGKTKGDGKVRYAIITSDGTKVGYDSNGERVNGGIGFIGIEQNLLDGVGFASVDSSTVSAFFTRLRKVYGDNKNVVVFVMLQSPSATIGNHYGAKYIHKAFQAVKGSLSKQEYLSFVGGVFEQARIKTKIDNKIKTVSLNDAAIQKGIKDKLNNLFNKVDSVDSNKFASALISDLKTSLDFRRELGKSIFHPTKKTKKGAPVRLSNEISDIFDNLGFNFNNFLDEYGEKGIMTQQMLDNDSAAHVVAGFQVNTGTDVEKAKEIKSIQNKGITHGLFDGKVPAVKGSNFFLDGLYDVRANFAPDWLEYRVPRTGEKRADIDKYSQKKYGKAYTSLSVDKKTKVKEWAEVNNLLDKVPPEKSGKPSLIAQGIPAVSERGIKIKPKKSHDLTLEVRQQIDIPQVMAVHNEGGGSSINQEGQNIFGTKNYSVSVHPDRSKIIDGKEITEEDILDFAEANADLLEDKMNFIGTWYNEQDGKTYMDISTYTPDKQKAIDMARKANQIAIFDLFAAEEIDTEGTGEALDDREQQVLDTQIETNFVPVSYWVESLKGSTGYLNSVVSNILRAREVLKKGKVSKKMTIKSYLITMASQGSGGGWYDNWSKKTNQTVDQLFIEKQDGRDWIRPEGAAAAYIVSENGKKLVSDLSNGTASESQILSFFEFVGTGYQDSKTKHTHNTLKSNGFSLMTDLFNENKGQNFKELIDGAIKYFKGIGDGKSGFFNQFLGVSGQAVIDARELNAWIAGSMKLTDEQKKKKEKVIRSPKLKADLISKIKEVGLALGFSEDLAGYMAHHAIWDGIKSSITTHQGEYDAVFYDNFTERQQIVPDKVHEMLTTDSDGQYVFKHYSQEPRKTVKPMAGDGRNLTGRGEAQAISTVGGLAMYYVSEGQKEAGVGDSEHTVTIEPHRVYYFNEDAENFYDEAERRFKAKFPSQAFTPNHQVAWITKVANENGYDMVISNWRNPKDFRAQTTLEMTPDKENPKFKKQEKDTIEVGDTILVFGAEAEVTAVNGNRVSFKGVSSSGTTMLNRVQKLATEREQANLNEATERESKTPNPTPDEIVRIGRENGFSDAAIKRVLEGKGFTKEQINDAMSLNIDLFTTLPDAFVDVKGGIKEGTSMFNKVLEGLKKLRKKRTPAEMAEEAVKRLRETSEYKNQNKTTQAKLESTIRTHFNAKRRRNLSGLRARLEKAKADAKNIAKLKVDLKNFIRRAIPKSDNYSKAQIERLIATVANVTEKNFEQEVAKVLKVVDQQREKIRKQALKNLMKAVMDFARKNKTASGKARARNIAAEGQEFFEDIKPILRAAMTGDIDTMLEFADKLSVDNLTIKEAIDKEAAGETLNRKERKLLNQLYGFDSLGNIATMSLEEVLDVYNSVKQGGEFFSMMIKARRRQRAQDIAEVQEQAKSQLQSTLPDLYKEVTKEVKVKDSQGIIVKKVVTERVLLSDKERKQKARKIRKALEQFKILEALQEFIKQLPSKFQPFRKLLVEQLAHLGTLSNIADRVMKGKDFFTENFYNALNRMDENHRRGRQQKMALLDKIAATIKGVKNYKQIRDQLFKGMITLTVNEEEYITNADEMLRMYALSLNDVQKDKLAAEGINNAVLEDIKKILGPEAIEFADKIVDYLTNQSYDEVNAVYSKVNLINLPFIDNYFPTRTISKKATEDAISSGNFSSVFNAETASSLKERVDQTGEIDLSLGFIDVLESHIDTMEKYKAYAEGIQRINDIFRLEDVRVALQEMGLDAAIRQAIIYAVNPEALQGTKITWLGNAMSKFTGFALAFKLIQIPKQMSSFINAYEDYSYRRGGKTPVLDAFAFMIDGAVLLAQLPKELFGKGPISEAMEMSATFRDRVEAGLKGDIYGLESGSSLIKPISKSSTKFAKAMRGLKIASGSPTVIGDVMGVMGYMINYKRDIANGMSKQEAVEKFNNYNATQQSRRAADKIPLQMSKNDLVRAFTMFGSTLFLQINKVAQSSMNIRRAIAEGKLPRQKDTRALVLNYALANGLFVFISNIFKFMDGDDEDKDEVMDRMKEAMSGLALLYQIPIMGSAAEYGMAKLKGERGFGTSVVNPLTSIIQKTEKSIKDEDLAQAMRTIIGMTLGTNVDPFVGLYNYFGPQDDPEALYEMLGVSPSYRPEAAKESSKKKSSKSKKEDIKKRYYVR